MMNKSTITRFLIISLATIGLVFISGAFNEANAQRDPFAKNPKLVTRSPGSNTRSPGNVNNNNDPGNPSVRPVKVEPVKPKGPIVVSAPPIEQRIAFFMSERERAALNGLDLPKVTSVLTLSEMSVIGIFKTPRGFAAMVEAEPIKLSFTIYPGERFFDGQLVAVEENRLVFRKVTKMSNNKFLSTVENKTLREYSVQQEIQGTAPVGSSGAVETADSSQPETKPVEDEPKKENAPAMVISPLDEMNKQKTEEPKDSAKDKSNKKPKVARRP